MHNDPERFCRSVIFFVPLEFLMCFQVQLNSDCDPCNGLNKSRNLKPWEFVDVFENHFAHLGELYKLSYSLCRKVEEITPPKLLFPLNPSTDFIKIKPLVSSRLLSELTKGRHGVPLLLLDHLA